ncbi:MAG TPA: hypothetical protein VGM10_04840 [Actinocrinis sp.]
MTTMTDELTAALTLPWHWEWVPGASAGPETRGIWSDHVVELFEDWTRGGWDAARAAWPKEAGAEFPFTAETVGRGTAQWLIDRADKLPKGQRLAWGAGFSGGWPRWAPVPVVVEFRAPAADDPIYLMELVGADPAPQNDRRGSATDYVTTPYGDGLRVLSFDRSTDGMAFGRLDAAMRLDWPAADDGRPAVRLDVVLTTRVVDMALMAVIGPGVEQLMQRIAAEPLPVRSGPARSAWKAAASVNVESTNTEAALQ